MKDRTRTEIRTITAAYLFTQDHTTRQIAEIMDISERQIYRYAKTPLWQTTLETLGYTGVTSLRKLPNRDRDRERGKQVEYTHEVWTQLIKEGCPIRNAARHTAEKTGIPLTTIRDWERRFYWREK